MKKIASIVYDLATNEVDERIYLGDLWESEGLNEYGCEGEIRYISSISEDWFFVLADYGYFIEKSTGRMIAKTEHEIAPSKEDEHFSVMLVPSDEDIYFYLGTYSSEEGEIYKIDLDE